jgi:hypothetical protein
VTDRDPPLVWSISRRSGGGEIYLAGLDLRGDPVWSQFWNDRALRFATAAEALAALRLYSLPGQGGDWSVSRITLRCLRTS